MPDLPPPRHLDVDRERGLTITWQDETVSFYPVDYLRRMSPSADQRALRDEMEKNPLAVLPSSGSNGPMSVTDAQMVGNYALRLTFSDGHDTGIYTWSYLRSIDPGPDSHLSH